MTDISTHAHSSPDVSSRRTSQAPRVQAVTRIAVGVDGYPEGRDAVALGAGLAEATGANLMLVAVHPDPVVIMPEGMNWTSLRHEAERLLRETRASLAPEARIIAETDLSVPRALQRVVRREHRDLLIVGSSRHAADGRARIGKRTRQLLDHFDCALAVAPRGLQQRSPIRFRRIGVGYDGGPESEAALVLARSIALACDAELHIRGVVDDRIPVLVRSALGGTLSPVWRDVIEEADQRLQEQIRAATHGDDSAVNSHVVRGRPADVLSALSGQVDLLVIGSRRWGTAARVVLGSTGEALLQDAGCAVLAVPRPAD
jgi:nucleotide-binding universal stress UspA family protein